MNFTNIKSKIENTNSVYVKSFDDINKSYVKFVTQLKVKKFRHISNLIIDFVHPVTIISGTNKVGKTSLLLMLACSHENFMKIDASKPEPTWREHAWKDVLTFTKHETETNDYEYSMSWRIGTKNRTGEGKRLASSRSWSGLGKKSKENRRNAKIKDREVRLIDLERLLPARSFSASLLRKSAGHSNIEINNEVTQSFCYVLDIPYDENFKIYEIGGHVNKRCYLIDNGSQAYSSYGAASGEESLINLLRDIIEAPKNSLILIDELEAGFHPSVQRKLVDLICQISWDNKKQFIITSHSSTVVDAAPKKSRIFIENNFGVYKVTTKIHHQSALSKMDSKGHPLVRLYCEDDLAHFLIKKAAIKIANNDKWFLDIFDIIESGPANDVRTDYFRSKHHYSKSRNKIGYCAIVDGDKITDPHFSDYSKEEFASFIYPYDAPERFLVSSYLDAYPNNTLKTYLINDNSHVLFQKMVELGMATDKSDARNLCYSAFTESAEYQKHIDKLSEFLKRVADYFS